MMEQAVPSAALIQKTKCKMMKGEQIMMKRSFSTAVAIVVVVMLFATTAFAAWYFLKPSEVAKVLDDNTLSAAFDSGTAVNINQSVASGEYIFTLLAVVTGKDITDMPYYNESVNDERTYAVVAIRNTAGSPMPDTSDDEYGKVSFLATPLIRGLAPWQYNAVTMNGGYSETVIDGVMYRIAECDGVAMFADRGLYFAVCSSTFINNGTFLYNNQTGEISVNPDYDGASAVFDLPIDPTLADPFKAEQYITGSSGDIVEDDGIDAIERDVEQSAYDTDSFTFRLDEEDNR